MTKTKMPDYVHSWIEVHAADGSNRRRLPAVLFDSQEHFDSVRGRIAALEAALREVEQLTSERDEAYDMIHEMCEKAEHWHGATASSHYRSYLFARIAKLTGRRP